jgi:type II secretory pathway pseudopilin PulG
MRESTGPWADERGYLMVALLVAISVMAILMTAAMPAWHTVAQREKEAELVFRGEQIARAIGLYQRRFANAPAPSIDFLVEQRFLRKKYKDPITNDDFQVLTSGTNASAPGQISSLQSSFQQLQSSLGVGRGGGAAGGAQGRGGTAVGGIIGVTSKSPLKSLRLYNGRDTYDQWVFVPVVQAARAGGPGGRGADVGRAGARGVDAGRAGGGRGGDGRGGRGAGPQGGGRGFELTPPARGRF